MFRVHNHRAVRRIGERRQHSTHSSPSSKLKCIRQLHGSACLSSIKRTQVSSCGPRPSGGEVDNRNSVVHSVACHFIEMVGTKFERPCKKTEAAPCGLAAPGQYVISHPRASVAVTWISGINYLMKHSFSDAQRCLTRHFLPLMQSWSV
jgi:hypothetical protein